MTLRRVLTTALVMMVVVAMVVAALAVWALRDSPPPMPALSGRIERGALQHDRRTRSWLAYVPAQRAAAPALVIALHASMGTAQQARETYGYDFDALADRHGFIVAYPNGYQNHWNDARVEGPFAAKRENVDDVGFLHALVDDCIKRYAVDRSRVFVTGISNGASMVLRLALETPRFARAYAVIAAAVPAPANMAMPPANEPVSILFMNGTDDPMNPWSGGDVVLYGVWGNRGPVLSTPASARYFRALAGLGDAPEVTAFPDRDPADGSTVERSVWTASARPVVALYAINGGGHHVPHPSASGRRLLGSLNRDIHAAREIWAFFTTAP